MFVGQPVNAARTRPGTCSCMDNSDALPNDVALVPVHDLHRRHQVRRALDLDHVDRLVEVLDRCPPIVISSDRWLVDGEHRVAAARRLGVDELPAVVLPIAVAPGDDLISAIEANASHGLPLTRQERRDAVAVILDVRPELSDRETARICGVARSVVVAVRNNGGRSGGSNDHVNDRLGRDGKRYGAAPPEWRALLEALVRVEPTTSVRALAERVGVSVGAAQSHRRKILDQLAAETWVRRWWRRLRARRALRHISQARSVHR